MGIPTFDLQLALLYFKTHPIEAISSAILVSVAMYWLMEYVMPKLVNKLHKMFSKDQ